MGKFVSFILTIIIIFLTVAIVIFGMTLYYNTIDPNGVEEINDIFEISANDISEDNEKSENTNEQETENPVIQDIMDNANKIINKVFGGENNEKAEENTISVLEKNFFYNQLNDNQKIIYSALQKNKNNLMKGDYVINFGKTFSNLLNTENGDKILGTDYQTAIEAFIHDDPELFYIDVNKMYINIEKTTKIASTTYKVYISPENEGTYYQNGFESYEQVLLANKNLEKTRDSLINSLTGTDYQKIKTIHNYLIDNIEYDSNFENNYKYTLYGALVDKKCVCEGYAKAFKYLVNAAGINCEILQGTSTNSNGATESHAWNCVEIGTVWYQVDVTWDDPIIIGGGSLSNKSRYRFFLKGTKTMENDHTIEKQFSDGGKMFLYPELSASDYD